MGALRSLTAHPDPGTDAATPFEAAALPHLGAAYALARRILGDDHDAQDAVQDAYFRAWRHFGAFRGGDARGWLLTIVRNASLTLRRRRGRERAAVTIEMAGELPGPGDGPEAALIRAAGAAQVRAAIERLGREFREVILLREMEGLSYAEISSALEIPIGTVMSRLARARQQLRALLMDTDSGDTRS